MKMTEKKKPILLNPKGGQLPRVLTDKEIIMVEAWAKTLTHEQIGDHLGFSPDTFVAIMARDPRVARSYKKGRAGIIEAIGNVVIQKALAGDLTACFFYLKTRANWRESPSLDIGTGSSDAKVKNIVVTYEDQKAT